MSTASAWDRHKITRLSYPRFAADVNSLQPSRTAEKAGVNVSDTTVEFLPLPLGTRLYRGSHLMRLVCVPCWRPSRTSRWSTRRGTAGRVRNILEKLQLHSRMQAVMYAEREKTPDLP